MSLPSDPADVRAFFERHRTVRRYTPEPMPPEHLDTILYAAQRAPTDATAQMYSFVRLTDPALRERLAELTRNPHLAASAESFVVCLDVARLRALLELRGYGWGEWSATSIHFGLGDAVMAGQNLLLAAELLGYAGCWVGGLLSALPEVVALLDLPPGVLPFAGLTLGRPAENPAQRPRLPRELVLHEDRYRLPDVAELEEALTVMAPITRRGDWAQTLARYFAPGGSMEAREGPLREVMQRQGFNHVKAPQPQSSFAQLTEEARRAGFPALQLRALEGGYEVWLDGGTRALRGEGRSPEAALLDALSGARQEA